MTQFSPETGTDNTCVHHREPWVVRTCLLFTGPSRFANKDFGNQPRNPGEEMRLPCGYGLIEIFCIRAQNLQVMPLLIGLPWENLSVQVVKESALSPLSQKEIPAQNWCFQLCTFYHFHIGGDLGNKVFQWTSPINVVSRVVTGTRYLAIQALVLKHLHFLLRRLSDSSAWKEQER